MLMVVLAGGFGTRLQTVVSDVPKPLAPVVGKPYLWYLLSYWISHGVRSFVLCLHYKSDQIIRFVQHEQCSGILKGIDCKYIVESEPMGTGGAIAHAVHELNVTTEFLVSNGDTWIGEGASQLLGGSGNLLTVTNVGDTGRFGTVELDDGFVRNFRSTGRQLEAGWINAGLYRFAPDAFSDWDFLPASLEERFLMDLVRRNDLRAVQVHGDFIDIGTPTDYFRFCALVESKRDLFYAL